MLGADSMGGWKEGPFDAKNAHFGTGDVPPNRYIQQKMYENIVYQIARIA